MTRNNYFAVNYPQPAVAFQAMAVAEEHIERKEEGWTSRAGD
ncbi:MAG: hypothetical protein PF904_17350 [Kiritimatiellae bacterium]|jgi:hypothetical protein|nr:hypothetical protein [Kiritimatiellia bacterium]